MNKRAGVRIGGVAAGLAGAGLVAGCYLDQDVNSVYQPLSGYDGTIEWMGQGSDSIDCENLEPGQIHWVLTNPQGSIDDADQVLAEQGLFDRVIFRCVIGSRAYGLDDENSDTDRRGIYLPPADLHWSLFGVPEQLENDETQEAYWELQKFIVLALKANPNVLECLYTPLVETKTPLADELLRMRSIFLSRLAYQTYNGYVMSQFKKMQTDLRNQGQVKWKHVMHLIRLLLSGITVLRERFVPVQVGDHREMLLRIKSGAVSWNEVETWRRDLHKQFDQAFEETMLPEKPDYHRANDYLVKARRLAMLEELP